MTKNEKETEVDDTAENTTEDDKEDDQDTSTENLYVNTAMENTCIKVSKLEEYIKSRSGEDGLENEFFVSYTNR